MVVLIKKLPGASICGMNAPRTLPAHPTPSPWEGRKREQAASFGLPVYLVLISVGRHLYCQCVLSHLMGVSVT